MAARQERITLDNFKGLNTGTQPHLIGLDEFIQADNVKFEDGEIVGYPSLYQVTDADYTAAGIDMSHPRVFQKVYVAASWFPGNTRLKEEAYLFVSADSSHMLLINPEDTSVYNVIRPVYRTLMPGTDPNEIANHCLVTGFDDDNIATQTTNGLFIKKGSAANTFVYSIDNEATYSGDQLVSSTTGTNITVGSATLNVKFLTDDISAIGTGKWKWENSDQYSFPQYYATREKTESFCQIGKNFIFTYYGRVMLFDGLACYELGYFPMGGTIVRNFFDHLVIGRFKFELQGGNYGFRGHYSDGPEEAYTFGWSHLNSLHEFYATNNNEADVYELPAEPADLSISYGIQAMEIWNDSLYVFTSQNCYRVDYVGLPLVMRVTDLSRLCSCFNLGSSCVTPKGIALIDGDSNLVLFDGQQTANIGERFIDDILNSRQRILNRNIGLVTAYFAQSSFPFGGFINMHYDPYDQSIVFMYGDKNIGVAAGDFVIEGRFHFEQGFSKHIIGYDSASDNESLSMPYVRDLLYPAVKYYTFARNGNSILYAPYNTSVALETTRLSSNVGTIELVTGDIRLNHIDHITIENIFPIYEIAPAASRTESVEIMYSTRDKLQDTVSWTSLSVAEADTIPVPIRKGGKIWRFRLRVLVGAAFGNEDFRLNAIVLQGTNFKDNVES